MAILLPDWHAHDIIRMVWFLGNDSLECHTTKDSSVFVCSCVFNINVYMVFLNVSGYNRGSYRSHWHNSSTFMAITLYFYSFINANQMSYSYQEIIINIKKYKIFPGSFVLYYTETELFLLNKFRHKIIVHTLKEQNVYQKKNGKLRHHPYLNVNTNFLPVWKKLFWINYKIAI